MWTPQPATVAAPVDEPRFVRTGAVSQSPASAWMPAAYAVEPVQVPSAAPAQPIEPAAPAAAHGDAPAPADLGPEPASSGLPPAIGDDTSLATWFQTGTWPAVEPPPLVRWLSADEPQVTARRTIQPWPAADDDAAPPTTPAPQPWPAAEDIAVAPAPQPWPAPEEAVAAPVPQPWFTDPKPAAPDPPPAQQWPAPAPGSPWQVDAVAVCAAPPASIPWPPAAAAYNGAQTAPTPAWLGHRTAKWIPADVARLLSQPRVLPVAAAAGGVIALIAAGLAFTGAFSGGGQSAPPFTPGPALVARPATKSGSAHRATHRHHVATTKRAKHTAATTPAAAHSTTPPASSVPAPSTPAATQAPATPKTSAPTAPATQPTATKPAAAPATPVAAQPTAPAAAAPAPAATPVTPPAAPAQPDTTGRVPPDGATAAP